MINSFLRIAAFTVVLCGFLGSFQADKISFANNSTASSMVHFGEQSCSLGANIEIESTEGTAAAGYSTLQLGFNAINAGTHRTEIVVKVCGSTTESATATLNRSGQNNASYNSILIRPVGGEARTMTGNVSGGALINFNGADHVTIDGINQNGDSLTITNISTSTSSNTSTITFQQDAQFNIVRNTTILGATTMSATTNGGNLFFHTAATSGTGNSNNLIENNHIGAVGSNLPRKVIHSTGSTGATNANSLNTIRGNKIYDFFADSGQSNGILIGDGSRNWTISDNHFFQTQARTSTGIHAPIHLQSSSISGISISGNVIGYSNEVMTGNYTLTLDGSGKFYPIYVSAHSTSASSSINGNTITAIRINGSGSGTGNSSVFSGIHVTSGLLTIGDEAGNLIGSTTDAESIIFSGSSSTNTEIMGIGYVPTAPVKIVSNNTVAGIRITATNSSRVFNGIKTIGTSTNQQTITGNTVGSEKAPIANLSTNSSSRTIGINNLRGNSGIRNNTVAYLNGAANNPGTNQNASMVGILSDSSGQSQAGDVSGNSVHNISNSSAMAVSVTGLLLTGDNNTNLLVDSNNVYGLMTGSTLSTSVITGIYTGLHSNIRNNMVALGTGNANGIQVRGIVVNNSTNTVYHNSVHIGGNGVSGTGDSFAFRNEVNSATRNHRNNIFMNARSNGTGTGKHYAVHYGGSTTAGSNSNYNLLLANGNGGVTGFFGNTDRVTFPDWQSTGFDANSYSEDPKFASAETPIPDLHIAANSNSIIDGNGIDVGVVRDFDGELRSELTPVDIGADAGDFLNTNIEPGVFAFAQDLYQVNEADGIVWLNVERSGGTDGEVTVSYSLKEMTATGGSLCSSKDADFIDESGTITFSDGEAVRAIGIEICDDLIEEPTETFQVNLTGSTAGTLGKSTSATVEIIDDDEESIVQFSSSIYRGVESSTAVISITRTGGVHSSVSVEWSADSETASNGTCGTSGVDYNAAGGTVEFAPGETEKNFLVALCSDILTEDPAETVTLTLSKIQNGSIGSLGTSTLYILDAATQSVSESTIILPAGSIGSEYPSLLNISGMGNTLANLRITLFGVTHSRPADLRVLLVSPTGNNFLLMSGVGGDHALENAVITFEDAATALLPENDAIVQGINYKPTVCSTEPELPEPAPSGPYSLPRCDEGSGHGATLSGTFGNTNPNGNWQLFISDGGSPFSPAGSAQISGWGMQFLVPTSANVSVAGRVISSTGRGIQNAIIRSSNGNNGEISVAVTNAFGYFVFENIQAGVPLLLEVSAKQRNFAEPQKIIVPIENMADVIFIADN